MAEHAFVPRQVPADGAGIRVEQQLGRVAAQPLVRIPRSADPEPIFLARADSRDETVVNGIGHFRQ